MPDKAKCICVIEYRFEERGREQESKSERQIKKKVKRWLKKQQTRDGGRKNEREIGNEKKINHFASMIFGSHFQTLIGC